MKLRFFFPLALAAVVIVTGCANRPDPNKDFQIGINGESYLWEPGTAAAYIDGYDMGYQASHRSITLVFPQQTPAPVTTKGLFVRFSTSVVQPGQDLRFDAASPGLDITYTPNIPIKAGKGTVNEFSSNYGDGHAIVRFDTLDNRLYGTLRGTIKYARLGGYFFLLESGEKVRPRKPVVIELYNWPFDLRLEQSRFYQ